MIYSKHTFIKTIIKAVFFCTVFTGLFFLFSLTISFAPRNYERLPQGIIGTTAAFLTTLLFLRFDKKKFSDIGLTFERKTLFRFLTGMLAGIIIMGLLAGFVLFSTKASIALNDNSNVFNFLLMTIPLIPLAVMEELGFRAYPLQILKDKTGIRLSIIITSILFALYHIAMGWSIASAFYGPAVWGLVFGLAAIYSNGIAMPTGLHYAANLTTAAFGTADSLVSIWIVKYPDSTSKGADWVTTLVPAIALLILAIICIECYMRRKATDLTVAAVKAKT